MIQHRAFSVSEVTRAIRETLEGLFVRLLVRGEVSNLSRPQSGHLYFSLVDDDAGAAASRLTSAQLACVVWRSSAGRLRMPLENGQKVLVTGRLTTYEPRGTYQLIVDTLEATGRGDLQRQFEELKEKLRLEGLFDAARKKPLPFLPERIAIVTSPSGAALRDVLRVLLRRHPRASVRIVPVRVQGEGAAAEIVRALELLQRGEGQAEVIIVTRGGGSLEDLWAFNEESVARAIAGSRIPVISAIGHEVDFTIADFVADVRAQTPTQAGEMVVPEILELNDTLLDRRHRLELALGHALQARRSLLAGLLRSRSLRHPQAMAQERIERVDDLARRLEVQLYKHLERWEDSLSGLAGRLEALSPLGVLARGYSLVTNAREELVREASSLVPGESLGIRFSRGTARVEVREVEA